MRADCSEANLFLSGDEAVARAAWECGVSFAAAYPGTPSTEILESLAEYEEVEAQWCVNEKVAYEVAYGSAIAGRRSLYASKHVGVNVAMDPLMTSAYMGVNAGFVAVTADDPGLHSSQNEQDNRLIAPFARLPLIEPSTPREAYAFLPEAYEISERFDIPVLFRLTTRIAHSKENVAVGVRRVVPDRHFALDIGKYVMVPRNAMGRHIDLEERMAALRGYANASPMNRLELRDTAIGFIADSVSVAYIREMYPDASLLSLGMPYPFPDRKILEFASKVKELYVVEELEPFLERELLALGLKPKTRHPSFRFGELRPEHIPVIVAGGAKPAEKAGAARRPQLCPGCPHAEVFKAFAERGLVVAGDIGCYTLGALPPYQSLHTCICMGGSMTFFQGMGKVLGRKVVGVIGDSTFVHTGVAGLIDAAYNGAKGVIVILDNATTAMTGNQPHPATGVTLKGRRTRKLVLEDLCRACGADNVDIVDPFKKGEFAAALDKRLAEDALTVIIARFPCVFVRRDQAKAAAPKPEKADDAGLFSPKSEDTTPPKGACP